MDIPGLLKSLNANSVRYVIIGATAFPVHGYTRATQDIDFFIEPTAENAQKTLKALTEFGYDTHDLSVQDLITQKILIHGYIVESDIHPFVAGVDNFEDIWAKSVGGNIQGIPTRFADLDSIIQMKRAAGRPKDIEDLKYLVKLKSGRL